MDDVEAVKLFLRGQNLEQIGRIDEAADVYEQVVAARFDSSGPYDRLIAIYADRARHGDVLRVASRALDSVRTHSDKRAWYERMKAEAERARARRPQAAPRRRR
jgi:hypothetical protein